MKPITVDDLISLLDAAGIRRAAVLSVAYLLGDPAAARADEYERVKAENDWTSGQVARFPDRLVGFCSVNPLKEYALDELSRCAKDPRLRRGLKLHFANSKVDYQNPAHIERILYGSDAASGGNLPPREGWAAFRRLPLTEAEFTTITSNLAPYMR
ncbi:hypothetical protein BH24ACI4_BH24ACI4_00890 [soil metagenome]